MSAQVLPLDFVLSPEMVGSGHDNTTSVFYKPTYDEDTKTFGFEILGKNYRGDIIKMGFEGYLWDRIECLKWKHFSYPGGIVIDPVLYTALFGELWKHLTGLKFRDINKDLAVFDDEPARYRFVEPQAAGLVVSPFIMAPAIAYQAYYGAGVEFIVGNPPHTEAGDEEDGLPGREHYAPVDPRADRSTIKRKMIAEIQMTL